MITANAQSPEVIIPLSFVFWGFVIVYVFHVLEESVLGDVFVDKVKRLYWDQYNWTKFTGFNTILLSLNILAVVLFECFGGAWLIFPLGLATERILNGFYHLFETIITKTVSSGLLTSIIVWILGYFLIRYSILKGEISLQYLIASIIIGVVLEFLMTSFMFFAPFRRKLNSMSTEKKQ